MDFILHLPKVTVPEANPATHPPQNVVRRTHHLKYSNSKNPVRPVASISKDTTRDALSCAVSHTSYKFYERHYKLMVLLCMRSGIKSVPCPVRFNLYCIYFGFLGENTSTRRYSQICRQRLSSRSSTPQQDEFCIRQPIVHSASMRITVVDVVYFHKGDWLWSRCESVFPCHLEWPSYRVSYMTKFSHNVPVLQLLWSTYCFVHT